MSCILNFGEKIGNGFNRGGLYYLPGRTYFSNTVLMRLQPTDGLLIEGFHLELNNDEQGTPTLEGVNLTYAPNVESEIGASYIKVDNVDTQRAYGVFSGRDGIDVYNLRGKTNLGLEAFSIESGYVAERPSRVKASAWYSAAVYQFTPHA
ncbi:TPA: hypothetical protein ACNIGS_001521 [Pseudomonas aeruginosa]